MLVGWFSGLVISGIRMSDFRIFEAGISVFIFSLLKISDFKISDTVEAASKFFESVCCNVDGVSLEPV